jgi:carboxyl-terminal processing protease
LDSHDSEKELGIHVWKSSSQLSDIPIFRPGRWLTITLVWFWICTFHSGVCGADAKTDLLLRQAEQAEKAGKWEQAGAFYSDLFGRDRQQFESLRDRYQICLRHVQQSRRHHEAAFRERVLNRDLSGAIKVYEEVLNKLRANYYQKDRVELTRLFKLGLEELEIDLDDGFFRQEYLPSPSAGAMQEFRGLLKEKWTARPIHDLADVKSLAMEVALEAQKTLDLKPQVAVMELACGACNALDEYTMFLTPGLLAETYASLDGKLIGIGIELDRSGAGQALYVAQVLKNSPAEMAGLKPRDRIVRINRYSADKLSLEQANEKLKGDVGTSVELEVIAFGHSMPRVVSLTRQLIFVPSVVELQMLDEQMGIGYFQLVGFQETTLAEMDEAVGRLVMRGMKVLVLDLRGNPGGLFQIAVQVAERFLTAGVIVATESQISTFNKTYTANNSDAWRIPLVLLIDSETASAAEVIAGAFKDHHRATLVGQTTFGKGCVQYVVELSSMLGGIKITQARFFSPSGHFYGKGGVAPHVPVERTSMMAFNEAQLQAAVRAAQQLVMMTPMR